MIEKNIYKKEITFKVLLAFTIPTILMTLIQASYSMIDGIFIANILGDKALSSLTLISPFFNLFMAIATMFSSGGCAIIMKKMGEKKDVEAKQDFTMLIIINIIIGIILSVLTLLFSNNLVSMFDASQIVLDNSNSYLYAYSFFIIFQLLLSNLLVYTIASGKTKLAMSSSIFGGVFNIVFDYILIKQFSMGMAGAAIASGFGMLIPCLILCTQFFKKSNMLYFVMPKFRFNVLFKTITNGFSEFSSYLVSGVVMMLFNTRMLSIGGVSGVAASTITFYVFGLMSALYMGYMFGVSPLISYFYGSKEIYKFKKIRVISLKLIFYIAITTTIISVLGSEFLVGIFTNESSESYMLAIDGNKLFSIALLFVGFNTFSSMLFTSLSNGKISAIISFFRTFIFLIATILILPILFGINGLWLAVPISELCALILSLYFFRKYKKQYQY